MKKTTLYIDVDDDIAGISDKIIGAAEKIVAVVLPKRPSVFQTSVNMRLIKKAGDDAAKNLVLITTDGQVIRLAGQSGVHVSKSLQSKPYIPLNETPDDVTEEIVDAPAEDTAIDPAQPDVYADDKKLDLRTPVGELTGSQMTDEIDLDNTDGEDNAPAQSVPSSKEKSGKKLRIPNFGSFRNKLLLGSAATVALIALLVWATKIAPHAMVTLRTERTEKSSKVIGITAATSQVNAVIEKQLLPAVKKDDVQKLNGSFTPSGQKDLGTKATGEVTLSIKCADVDGDTPTIPGGTGVSSGDKTFITNTSVTLDTPISGPCRFIGSVGVTASQNGDSYNLSARSYAVAGYSAVTATDSEGMSGGTSKLVKVVAQSDVDAAKEKLLSSAANDVKGKLTKQLADEKVLAIADSYSQTIGAPVLSTPVDGEASATVSIAIDVASSILGVKYAELEPLINQDVNKQIDISTQKIIDSGVSSATTLVQERQSPQSVKFTVNSTAKIGPMLDESALAMSIKGQRAGQAKQTLEARPGINQADIRLSPFWVFSIPSRTEKIDFQFNE